MKAFIGLRWPAIQSEALDREDLVILSMGQTGLRTLDPDQTL